MANIQPQIDAIRKARHGRDVRESIASGIEAMNGESSTAYSAAITAQNSASASALAAKQSEDNALGSANVAQTQATNAQNSAAAAKASEDNASVSATTATNAAGTSQNILVQVQASATAAKSSEDAATAAADSAAKAAKDADDARILAQQHATDSLTSATTASNAQTQSGINATNAQNSAAEAEKWAKQAAGIVGAGTATPEKPGFVAFDNSTIKMNANDQLYAAGVNDHIADNMVSTLSNPDGVHNTRIYINPTTKKRTLQTWDKTKSEWVDQFTDIKMPDDGTITMDPDGTVHGTANIDVDDFLSETSTNPVQNKVVTEALLSNNKYISDKWDSSKTYSKGTYCIHADKLYKAIQDITLPIQPPNATYWEACTVAEEISKINTDLTATPFEVQFDADSQNIFNIVGGNKSDLSWYNGNEIYISLTVMLSVHIEDAYFDHHLFLPFSIPHQIKGTISSWSGGACCFEVFQDGVINIQGLNHLNPGYCNFIAHGRFK